MRLAALALLAFIAVPAMAQDEAETFDFPAYEISADLSALPKPVARTRQRLIDAALSGDIDNLRAIIADQQLAPTVSFGGPDDAVDYLKAYSADGEGYESLGILLKLLDAPYAIFDSGSENPSYVWPYLAVVEDLSALTPTQKVDAYRLLTHEQLNELIELDAWYYWRVYIGKDGAWQAFVAGD